MEERVKVIAIIATSAKIAKIWRKWLQALRFSNYGNFGSDGNYGNSSNVLGFLNEPGQNGGPFREFLQHNRLMGGMGSLAYGAEAIERRNAQR
jgi:hypothetical protein